MWLFDPTTLAFLEVNEAAVRHYGYSREEFLSMTLRDICPPEDMPAVAELASRPFVGIEEAGVWRHLKKDETIIYAEIIRQRLSIGGGLAVLVLSLDVTER